MRAPSGRAMRLRIAAIQCRQPQSQCRPLSLSSSSPLLASASAQRRLLHSSSSCSSSSNTNSPSIQAAPPSSSSSSSGSPSSGAAAAASPASSSGSSSSGSSPKLPPSSSSLSRRKNTDLALILSGTLGISALLFYNLRPQAIEPAGPAPNISSVTPSSRAFTLPVATSSGTQFRQIDMLPAGAVTQLLSKNERSYAISRPGNPLFRYDTNSVASNETCEDAHSFTILEHQGNDYILTSMFDGHAGYATSRLMSTDLEKYIARELMDVLSGVYRSLSVTGEGWWEWLWNTGKKPSTRTTSAVPSVPSQSGGGQAGNGVEIGLDQRSALIPEALRRAYQLADRDIINAPSNYLRSLTGTAGAKEGSIPQMTEAQRSRGLSLLSPALSGSCGLSALIDCSSPQLYVAIAGDSRAVMGTYDAATNKWTAETLSEDQTGRSVKEVNRVRSEHPKNESETVIMRGRVLGGLEPTRAFGDGKYKFPLGVQEKLIQAFRPNTSRTAPPSLYKTPPYVTALPEVTTFALAANPAAIAGFTPTQKGAPSATLAGPPAQSDTLTNYTPLSTSNNTALPDGVPTTGSSSRDVGRRFVVLATDGLYDCLSSEEVVALVAGHLDGLKGDKSKKELFEQIGSVKNDPTAAGTASPHKPRSAAENSATKRYCFEDSNICTHLIRNALGGAQREQVSALLSIPPPHSRRYRDDITITVLLLGSDPSNASSTASEGSEKLMQGVRRIWTSPEKAKL